MENFNEVEYRKELQKKMAPYEQMFQSMAGIRLAIFKKGTEVFLKLEEDTAKAREGEILLSIPPYLAEYLFKKERTEGFFPKNLCLSILKDMLAHECQHIKSSSFEEIKKLEEWAETSYPKSKDVATFLGFNILNIIEDGRIDAERCEEWKGDVAVAKLDRYIEWENTRLSPFKGEEAPDEMFIRKKMDVILASLHSWASSGREIKDFEEAFIPSDLGALIQEQYSSIDKGIMSCNTKGAADATKEIVTNIISEYEEEIEEFEKNKELLEKLKEEIEKFMEKLEDSWKDESRSSKKASSSSASKSGKKKITMPGAQSSSNESNKNEEKADEDVSPSNENSSDENSSDENSSDENSSDGNSSDEETTDEECKDGEAPNEKTPSGKPSSEESTEKKSSFSPSARASGKKEEEEMERAVKSLEEEAEKAAETERKKMAEEKAEKEEKDMPGSLSPKIKEKIKDKTRRNITETKFSDMRHAGYKPPRPAEGNIKKAGAEFEEVVERILRNKSEEELHFLEQGNLDIGQIYNLCLGEGNVFMTPGIENSFTGAIQILIDNSGSMWSDNKQKYAHEAVAIMEEGLRNHVPLKIAEFEARGQVLHYVLKDWEETGEDNHCLSFPAPGSGNEDDVSILIATEELLARPEEKKMLVVVSDGLPPSEEDVKEAVKYATDNGVFVVAIAVGNEEFRTQNKKSYKNMYENFIDCEPEKLAYPMANAFEQWLED